MVQNSLMSQHLIILFLISSGVSERARKQMNVAELMSEASSPEQMNERKRSELGGVSKE